MSAFKKMPKGVVEGRRDICKQAGCLHQTDPEDNCAACPAGHWGPYGGDCVPVIEIPRDVELFDQVPSTQPPDGDMTFAGPKLWALLEERPATCDLSKEAVWLALKFARMIPCGDCRAHWASLAIKNPPNLSSRRAYWLWVIFMHNEVNKKLGKPIFTPEVMRF